jgi:hypothetical protein
MPPSSSAFNIPTCTDAKPPPPANTNAVVATLAAKDAPSTSGRI